MKKIIILTISFFIVGFLKAQNIEDALRFSQTDINGTARFNAMSGAFGALGGDLSSMSINPASSSIFANNQAGATVSNFSINNNSTYFGNKDKSLSNNFDISQAGGVLIFKDNTSKWNKFALGLNYNTTKNLNNSLFSSGFNNNSVANYFTSFAQGIPQNVLSDYFFDELNYNEQQAFLGYQSYIINPTSNATNETNYFSNVPVGANYQQYTQENKGLNGKISFNASAQYNNVITFGINLNAHFVDYTSFTSFFESNNFENTTNNYLVNRLRFNNDLYTYGNGFSFQVGTILKPIKQIRVGITYDSPTWLELNDELSQSAFAVRSNNTDELQPDIADPQITTIFAPYRLQTPSKYSASFAYIFGKRGLLSFDYSLKDYNNTQLKPNNDFSLTNNYISTVLKAANEYRIGGEYKIEKWSLRGGYRFEESPYKNKKTIGDLYGISSGLGYNFGETKLDVSYAYSKRKYNQQFFSQGLTDYSTLYQISNTVSVTLLFEL